MSLSIGIYSFKDESVIDKVILACNASTDADRKAATTYFVKTFPFWGNRVAMCSAAKQLKLELEQKRLAERQAVEVKKIQDRSPVQEVEVIEKLSNDKTKLYLMIGGTALLLGAAVYIATK